MKTSTDEKSEKRAIKNSFWLGFRGGRLWRTLKKVPLLRKSLYLVLELRAALCEEQAQAELKQLFQSRRDPWNFETSSSERERFDRLSTLLDSVAPAHMFGDGLEIGCAEGLYTEALAERCRSLLAVDFSPIALGRAEKRRLWHEGVKFAQFDLRQENIPGKYDLIVIAAVLECMPNPFTLRRVRKKLVNALRPGGYLLVQTTRHAAVIEVLENSWWSAYLLRGKRINRFIATHPMLRPICSVETDWYVIDLCQATQAAASKEARTTVA